MPCLDEPLLGRRQVFALAVQDAGAVDADDVAGAVLADTRVVQQLGHRHACGAGADDDDAQLLHPLADDLRGVDQGGEGDDGRAVLIVVEHRDVERFLEAALDLEALGRLDVLEVDAAERRRDRLADRHHLVDGAAR